MLKKYIELECNECHKKEVVSKIPSGWVKTSVIPNVHFCCKACLDKSLKRIEDAHAQVYGKQLGPFEMFLLNKKRK